MACGRNVATAPVETFNRASRNRDGKVNRFVSAHMLTYAFLHFQIRFAIRACVGVDGL